MVISSTLALIAPCVLIVLINFISAVPPPLPQECRARGFTRAPLILINIDGMHPTYLKKDSSNLFKTIASKGVFSEYMRPVYPTKTFPNLYTIVTGLYPESHGIVDNHFKDPESGTEFLYNKDDTHNRIKWGGEPIWITAKKNGLETSVRHWAGSQQNFNGIGPSTYSKPGRTSFLKNAEGVYKLLKLPESQRPQFITLYYNEPDSTVHKFGPNDPKVITAISKVTASIKALINALHKDKILNCVNIIIVSDHGGTTASCDSLVYLNQIANLGHVSFLAGPSVMIQKFKSQFTPDQLFEKVRCPKTQESIYDVYKKQDVPRRHHYSNNPRIGDLVLKMKEPFNMFRYNTRPPPCDNYKGGHGYDDGLRSMQSIFLAYGPHFKKGQRILPFQNIELYNLMAVLLGVEPAPNNGTYGLLADALTIPFPPKPPVLQPVNFYDYRTGSGVGIGGGVRGSNDIYDIKKTTGATPIPIDDGYGSDIGYDYNKKFKKRDLDESFKSISRLIKRQEDAEKYPMDNYYGGTVNMNEVEAQEDIKAEKERQHKQGLGSRFLDLFRRKQTPPPGPEPDEDLKILYGPDSKNDDLGVTQLPKIVTQPTKILGDNNCCQLPYGGGRSSTGQSSEIGSTQTIITQSMPFGIPKSTLGPVSILPEKNYVIGYDETNNYPLFVSYLPSDGQFSKQTSTGCIKIDERVSQQNTLDSCHLQSNLKDKHGNKLMPLKLFNGANSESSNVLSNVVYVYEDFYNNIWAETLRIMNDVAKKRGAIVMIGPVFDHNGDSVRDNMATVPSYVDGKRIPIPSHFFVMTLYCRNNQGTNCAAKDVVINAFVIPHTKQPENCETVEKYFRKHYARIKDIELLTGLNFFLKYPESDRIKLTTHFYLNLDK